jgi:hypothetical protein
MFALEHDLDDGEPQVNKATPLGGGMTFAALGCMAAFVASLVAQHLLANTSRVESLVPATLPAIFEVGSMTPAALVTPSTLMPSVDSGLYLQLETFGTTCSTLKWNASGLLYDATMQYSRQPDASTGKTVHTFACSDCTLGPLSSLLLQLNVACRSTMLTAVAVNVEDGLDVAQYAISMPGDANVAAIALDPTFTHMQDNIARKEMRGLALDPQAAVYSLQDDVIDELQVVISLAVTRDYVMLQIDQITSTVQLLSNIIGLSGIIGGFALLFRHAETALEDGIRQYLGNALTLGLHNGKKKQPSPKSRRSCCCCCRASQPVHDVQGMQIVQIVHHGGVATQGVGLTTTAIPTVDECNENPVSSA